MAASSSCRCAMTLLVLQIMFESAVCAMFGRKEGVPVQLMDANRECGPKATAYLRNATACATLPRPPTTIKATRAVLEKELERLRANRKTGNGWTDMWVDPLSKTIFCGIYKNAHTEFKNYFTRLGYGSGPLSQRSKNQDCSFFNRAPNCAPDLLLQWGTPAYERDWGYCTAYYDTWSPFHGPGVVLGDYDTSQVASMLLDSSWTRAVVLRDPVQRLSSFYTMAFVDTWKPPNDGPVDHYVDTFHMSRPERTNFSHFVRVMTKPGTKPDPHWAPQSSQCGLQSKWIRDTFNVAIPMPEVSKHAKSLFQCTGTWHACGASGWGRYYQEHHLTPRHPEYAHSYMRKVGKKFVGQLPSAAFMQSNTAGHRTAGRRKLQHFTLPKEDKERIRKYYHEDFVMMRSMLPAGSLNPLAGLNELPIGTPMSVRDIMQS